MIFVGINSSPNHVYFCSFSSTVYSSMNTFPCWFLHTWSRRQANILKFSQSSWFTELFTTDLQFYLDDKYLFRFNSWFQVKYFCVMSFCGISSCLIIHVLIHDTLLLISKKLLEWISWRKIVMFKASIIVR